MMEELKRATSYRMSKVKTKDTKPELIVRKYLFAMGVRYHLHAKYLPGRPDLVMKSHKIAVFVNGCFWHGHVNCKRSSIPKSNVGFWKSKIENNVARDIKNSNALVKEGWSVIVVWECQLQNSESQRTLSNLFATIVRAKSHK